MVRLYHGSNVAIKRPDVTLNTGFADLGRGFYLTDDLETAKGRALARARKLGEGVATVSVFDLDERCVAWATWDAEGLSWRDGAAAPIFGLCFDESPKGIAAWASYIKACRQGKTEVEGLGSPAIVRAWIATQEVEMACSGFIAPAELGEFVSLRDLIVQYCLPSQGLLDRALTFVEAIAVTMG